MKLGEFCHVPFAKNYQSTKYEKVWEGMQSHLLNGPRQEQKGTSNDLFGMCFIITKWNQEEGVQLCSQHHLCSYFKPPFPVVESPALLLFAQSCSEAPQDGNARKSGQYCSGVHRSHSSSTKKCYLNILKQEVWDFFSPGASQRQLSRLVENSSTFYEEFFAQVSTPGLLLDWLWFKPDNLAHRHASKENAEGPFLSLKVCCHRNTKAPLSQVPKPLFFKAGKEENKKNLRNKCSSPQELLRC